MYNYEEDILGKRRTTVLEAERTETASKTNTTERKSGAFSPVTKNKSRLTVTNTNTVNRTAEVGKSSKQKEKVTVKNVAMMVVFSVVALAISAVIAVNAIAIGGIAKTNTQLANEMGSLQATYQTLSAELAQISSEETIKDIAASQLDLTATSASTATFSVPGYVTHEAQTFDNNWFDVMLDKLA